MRPMGAGGDSVRAGSQRPNADMYQRDNAPGRPKVAGTPSLRGDGSRPTADEDEMGLTEMLAMGGDVEGEDTTTHVGTLAEAIAKRLAKHMMAAGGEVDLEESSKEHGNTEDDLSFDALGKETV